MTGQATFDNADAAATTGTTTGGQQFKHVGSINNNKIFIPLIGFEDQCRIIQRNI